MVVQCALCVPAPYGFNLLGYERVCSQMKNLFVKLQTVLNCYQNKTKKISFNVVCASPVQGHVDFPKNVFCIFFYFNVWEFELCVLRAVLFMNLADLTKHYLHITHLEIWFPEPFSKFSSNLLFDMVEKSAHAKKKHGTGNLCQVNSIKEWRYSSAKRLKNLM